VIRKGRAPPEEAIFVCQHENVLGSSRHLSGFAVGQQAPDLHWLHFAGVGSWPHSSVLSVAARIHESVVRKLGRAGRACCVSRAVQDQSRARCVCHQLNIGMQALSHTKHRYTVQHVHALSLLSFPTTGVVKRVCMSAYTRTSSP